jgi:hypothetical protein
MSRKLLNESVLVLNKFYLAIQVTIARESISALVSGKALVLDLEYRTYDLEEWKGRTKELNGTRGAENYPGVVRSPSTTLLIPQVIVDPDCEFNNPHIKTIRYSRRNLYQRDNNTCQYCGKRFDKKDLTIDHVVPRSKGGRSEWTNVVACCEACNTDKKDHTLEEMGWVLLKKPTRPRWKSHIGRPFDEVKKRYWEQFLP